MGSKYKNMTIVFIAIILFLTSLSHCNIPIGQCHIPVQCDGQQPSFQSNQQERGPQGSPGKRGPVGPQGVSGPPGPDGRCACTNLKTVETQIENLKNSLENMKKEIILDCSLSMLSSSAGGVQTIYPHRNKSKSVEVMCDMDTGEGGWTIIQRRFDGSQDFYQDWDSYVNGFGNVYGEYWIGLETLHQLTKSKNKILRVDLEDRKGNMGYATYSTFVVDSAETDYTLTVSGYQGNISDSLIYHNGMKFSTKDHERDTDITRNCAKVFRGAWWYKSCRHSNLNGDYREINAPNSVNWFGWKANEGLKSTKLMIKPI